MPPRTGAMLPLSSCMLHSNPVAHNAVLAATPQARPETGACFGRGGRGREPRPWWAPCQPLALPRRGRAKVGSSRCDLPTTTSLCGVQGKVRWALVGPGHRSPFRADATGQYRLPAYATTQVPGDLVCQRGRVCHLFRWNISLAALKGNTLAFVF